MHWIARSAAIAVSTLALALSVANMAVANTAPVQSVVPVSNSGAQAACTYTINANNVNIRYGPGTDYDVYKVKNKGQKVTGPAPCHGTVFRTGYWWVQLIRGDGGGYVWVAENYV